MNEEDLKRIIRDVLSDVWAEKDDLTKTCLSTLYTEAVVQCIRGMIDEKLKVFREELSQRLRE